MFSLFPNFLVKSSCSECSEEILLGRTKYC